MFAVSPPHPTESGGIVGTCTTVVFNIVWGWGRDKIGQVKLYLYFTHWGGWQSEKDLIWFFEWERAPFNFIYNCAVQKHRREVFFMEIKS